MDDSFEFIEFAFLRRRGRGDQAERAFASDDIQFIGRFSTFERWIERDNIDDHTIAATGTRIIATGCCCAAGLGG